MKSSMYISAEQIQVLGYSGKRVKRVSTYPLPEGTMFNGNIMDSAFLTECLVSMKKDNPVLFKGGVSLVVDGGSIPTRRLTVPRLSHKQYMQRIRDDFADSIADSNEMVCAYRKMSDGTILGCGVNRAQVDNYINTFKAAKIKLNTIHIGAEQLYTLVKTTPALHESTIVLNILDGQTMLSAVFVKGNNIMMQRTRLYGDEKAQIHSQIIENLINLNQFAQSQKHEEITQSYYLGISTADVALLERSNLHDGISIIPLMLKSDNVELPPGAHFAYLNIKYSKGGIDLIEAREELDRYIKSKKAKKYWIPLVTVYVLALLGIAGYLWYELREVGDRIDDIYTFIRRPDVVETQAELNNLMGETNRINTIRQQFNNRILWEESMPVATRHLLNQILFNHELDVEVNSFIFTESTGIVEVSATTPDARIATFYVRALYDMGVAQDVRYLGYGSSADGNFAFTIAIYLAVEEDEDATE
jgi:hypothetical protein